MEKMKKLMEHRDAILCAEIGALIHDLGKLSEEFISEKSPENPLGIDRDEHGKWVFKWHPNLENLLDINIEILDKQISLKNIVKKHHSRNIRRGSLISLFKRDADGIDSGIDKGAVSNTNKQRINHTYISTTFGYELKKIDINSEQLKKHREKFVQKLEAILEKIQKLRSNNGTLFAEDWVSLRGELLNSARECFIHALGETRRSANDVTLWDHSYSTASLYKTALANIVLSGQWKDPGETKWRLLSVRFNGFDYITKSNKVGDILGRKKRVELALNLVRDLLEVYIPLGNEIYRDENGSVFLIPESFKRDALDGWIIGDEKLSISLKPDTAIFIKSNDTVKSAIEKIFDEVPYSELRPIVNVSEPSRGAANLGKELKESKVLFNQPFANKIKEKWNNKKAPVCKVCGLKPCEKEKKGYSDLCEDCRKIRESRARLWYNERIRDKSTIWIDEVCDINGRVGVIVGAFDLDNWLNGMWLNTTFTKTLDDLKKDKDNTKVFHEIHCWEDLINAVKEALDKNNPESEISFKKSDGTNIKVRELFRALVGKAYHDQEARKFFDAIIKNREEDVVKWAYHDKLSNNQEARLLILALFRKNPSFARIRRIWETTRRFWNQIESLIKGELNKKKRTKIIFKIPPAINLNQFSAYVLKIKGVSIPVLYLDRGEFLIIETWDILEASGINEEFLEENLREGNFELWQPSEYKEESKKLYPKSDVEMPKFVSITEDSEYYPYITILKEPTIFVALIPLQRSWDIIKLIKKEYEIQFSKVQNRLPIKLGLIAFKRKYPLYVVLDTVKRFLNEEIEEKILEVKKLDRISEEENYKKFDGRLGKYANIIELSKNCRKFRAHISYSTGDPSFKDVFYPYAIVKDNSGIETLVYKEYAEKYGVSNLVRIKYIPELSEKEEIFFEPSLFDFIFLDSNIRRFDVGRERKHWLFTESTNKPKPYLLWDIDNFEKLRELIIEKLELTTTQVMNLYEVLMSKIEEWGLKDIEKLKKDKAFEKFVDNTIKSIPLRLKVIEGEETGKGKITKEDYEFLRDSILNGMFFDFVDLWHTILKFKFKEGGEENV